MISINRAEPGHAQLLSDIAMRSKAHWGYPDTWLSAWKPALTLSPGYISGNEVHVASGPEGVAGFYAIEEKESGWELEHLWVDPDHMGKGIGRVLFEHASGRARQLGVSRFLIESDPNAEGFYRHMGAERIGERNAPVLGESRSLPLLVISL